LEREDVKRRLVAGESLEISTGGGSYEVWTEPYANPAQVFFEGRPFPYQDLERVIDAILNAVQHEDVTCWWVEPLGLQVKKCKEAYRKRAALL
jgi:hypothetical protein